MKRCRLIPKDSTWFCSFCRVEQQYEKPVYGVPLCRRCLFARAEQPQYSYYHEARAFVLEIELEQVKRSIEVMRRVTWQELLQWQCQHRRRVRSKRKVVGSDL